MNTNHPTSTAQRRAYIGRGTGGGFFGYVTDVATGQAIYEEGEWNGIDAALQWARERADQVVVTYGGGGDSRFSAGVTGVTGRDGAPLPLWPPTKAVREAIDRAVDESDRRSPPMPGELGAARAMIVRDDTRTE